MIINTWEYNGIKVRFTFIDGTKEEKFTPHDQSYAICFREDGKIIIGFAPHEYQDWLLPGGRKEKNETGIETLKRELDEELSLEVIKVHLLGAQKVEYLNKKKPSHYQLRYVAIVKVKKLKPDPDTGLYWKRKAIDPKKLNTYLKWNDIGDHLTTRAIEWYNKQK